MNKFEVAGIPEEAAKVFEANRRTVAAENIKTILDRLWESGGPRSTPVIITRDIVSKPSVESSPSWRRGIGRFLMKNQTEAIHVPVETHTEQVAATKGYRLFNYYEERKVRGEPGVVLIQHSYKGDIVFTREGMFATDASEKNTSIGYCENTEATRIRDRNIEVIRILPHDGYITIGEHQLQPLTELSDPEGMVHQLMGYTNDLNSEHRDIDWYVDFDPEATWLRPEYDEQGYVQIVDGLLARAR